MTWQFRVSGGDCEVIDPDGNTVKTLDWHNHKPDDSTADGWAWTGDYPAAVVGIVAQSDPGAAFAGDITEVE